MSLLRSLPRQPLVVASSPEVAATPVQPPVSPSPSSPALVRHLLQAIAATPVSALQEALPALRILALALAAALALRIAGATLHAIDAFPLVGGLLELAGLVRLLQFLSRNALRQQRRAELLARIEDLRQQLLG